MQASLVLGERVAGHSEERRQERRERGVRGGGGERGERGERERSTRRPPAGETGEVKASKIRMKINSMCHELGFICVDRVQ